jgi:hypothetical protein
MKGNKPTITSWDALVNYFALLERRTKEKEIRWAPAKVQKPEAPKRRRKRGKHPT